MTGEFSVSVSRKSDKIDSWYLSSDEIKIVGNCLYGIPGINGQISFSDHIVRSNLGWVDRTLRFTISFKGSDGIIGSNFLYAALEESLNWKIDNYSLVCDLENDFELNLTIAGAERNLPLGEIVNCINKEIQDPKWEKCLDKFSLNFTGDFIKVK